MRIAREEIFGPVLTVVPFDGFEEGIRLANDNAYGLAAGVVTQNPAQAHKAARALRSGVVWVNTFAQFDPTTPFGGRKFSGFGSEAGMEGLNNYLENKSVWISLA